MNNITLNLGGLNLSIHSKEYKPIQWLKNNYSLFCGHGKSHLAVVLESADAVRKISPPAIHCNNSNILINTGQFEGEIDLHNKRGAIKCSSQFGYVDLVRLLYAVLLLKKGGFFVHASTVVHRGKAYVFCGPSESGKTTIARLSDNHSVLSDETTAMVKEGRNYYAYATPFYGDGGPVKVNIGAQIKAILFIKKARQFTHKRLTAAESLKTIFPNILFNAQDRQWTDKLMDNLLLLTKHIPCYEFYFRPEPKIWSYLDEHIK